MTSNKRHSAAELQNDAYSKQRIAAKNCNEDSKIPPI